MAQAKIIELDETNTCKICENVLALYSCPKCNIIYCSLECYRSRSHLECSEQFYKENILEELQLDKDDNAMQVKMLDILKRTHDSNRILPIEDESVLGPNINLDTSDIDSDDDPDYLDISERLAGVNLDDAEKVWERLTEDEKQDFVAFLKSEDVSKLIPSWEPWWMHYNDGKIEDMSQKDNFKDKCPKLCDIKDFAQLTQKTPADCLKYNLINILAAYTFTMKYFNGECCDFAQESISCIMSLSLTVKCGQNFENFETAVKSVEQECINSDWIVTDKENIEIMRQDLTRILKGPNPTQPNFYILCALSDLNFLLNKSVTPVNENNGNFTKKFPDEHFPTVKLENPKKVKNVIKKIEYFLSYVKDYYNKM